MKSFKLCAFADEANKDLSSQINAMKRNGIKGLEIRGIGDQNISDITLAQAKEIKTELDANGLYVWSIGSPSGKIGIKDDFAPHLESFKRQLETAKVLGAAAYRLFSFFMPENENPNDYKDEVFYRLEKFTEAAEGYDITLCHENEKAIFGDTLERCVEIHKAIPKLKAVFDPANFVQCGQDTQSAFKTLENSIFYLHIKDSLKDGSIVPAGKGDGNIKEILKMYKGEVITLEPHLYEFSGLKNLEKEGERSCVGGYNFSSGDEAFDFASDALKDILKEIV